MDIKDDLDAWAQSMQSSIDAQVKEQFGQKVFDRWQNPVFFGVLQNPDASASLTGQCGDTIEIFLSIKDDLVKEAFFNTDGCMASVVAGSAAAELARGRTLTQAADLDSKAVLDLLGGLPEDHIHCAHLAASTVRAAIDNYFAKTLGKKAEGK
jgi:nitrogen fixation NifU-like protein